MCFLNYIYNSRKRGKSQYWTAKESKERGSEEGTFLWQQVNRDRSRTVRVQMVPDTAQCVEETPHSSMCVRATYFRQMTNKRTAISPLPGYRDCPYKLQRESTLWAEMSVICTPITEHINFYFSGPSFHTCKWTHGVDFLRVLTSATWREDCLFYQAPKHAEWGLSGHSYLVNELSDNQQIDPTVRWQNRDVVVCGEAEIL